MSYFTFDHSRLINEPGEQNRWIRVLADAARTSHSVSIQHTRDGVGLIASNGGVLPILDVSHDDACCRREHWNEATAPKLNARAKLLGVNAKTQILPSALMA